MKPQIPILVVDDDADVRELARQVLEIAGYFHISEARDGLEALRLLRDTLAPVVVLSDFHMPRQNGVQLIDALTSDPQCSPRHACILMTGSESLLSPANVKLLRQRSVPILPKPFDLDELIGAVDCAVERLASDMQAHGLPAHPRIPSGPFAP